MRLETVNIALFLCFISKKTYSAEVLITDVPEEFIPTSDHDYFYNDYDINEPIEIIIPQPRTKEKLNYNQKQKFFCQRFGSMFGIPLEKHKCGFIRVKQDNGNKLDGILTKQINKRQLNSISNGKNQFSQDYVDNFWRFGKEESSCTVDDFINNKCKLKSNELKQLETNQFSNLKSNGHSKPTSSKFSENNVDDSWRNTNVKNYDLPCTEADFINDKCVLNSNGINKLETSQFSDSKSVNNNIKKSKDDDFWRTKNVNGFSNDYGDGNFRMTSAEIETPPCSISDFINNKCNQSDDPNKLKKNRFFDSNLNKERNTKGLLQNYGGNSLRISSVINNLLPCSVNDIINNGCNLNSDDLHLLKTRQISDLNLDKETNEKSTSEKEFSQDDDDDFFRITSTESEHLPCSVNDIINNECNLNSDDQFSGSNLNKKMIGEDPMSATGFSQDYADDFWESKRTISNCCTIYDIINNICKLNTEDLFCLLKYGRGGENTNVVTKKQSTDETGDHDKPLYSVDYMNFTPEEGTSDPVSTEKQYITKIFIKPKSKDIDTLRRGNFIQFRPNQFRNKKRSRYSDEDSAEDKSESEEKPKRVKLKRFQIVKNKKTKKEKKKPKKQSSDSDNDSTEKTANSNEESADATSVERTKKKNVKSESDIENNLSKMDEINSSDSFETGPKKASEKYEYLQGHRVVKPKKIKARRASRLQTFLPKRYHWKLEDIHNLGYYWFEGPKGAFPSENM